MFVVDDYMMYDIHQRTRMLFFSFPGASKCGNSMAQDVGVAVWTYNLYHAKRPQASMLRGL